MPKIVMFIFKLNFGSFSHLEVLNAAVSLNSLRVPPGDILLEEFLKPMEITQSQLAKDINVPANRINQLIHYKREITADTALRLGRYFGIEPDFWLNLQSRYNMKMEQIKVGRKIVREVKVIIKRICS